MTPVKLLCLLPLGAALAHGQNQCVLELASQSDKGQSGFILSLTAAADSSGNCQLGSIMLGLSVGNGKSLHTVQAPFSWQTGVVYTVTAVITGAGPQQLSINGQSAGSVAGAFTPAQGTLYASNADDSGTATEAYIVTQISLQVSNGSNSVAVAPNGNAPIPLPLVLLGGGPVSWQTGLTIDPTKTTTVTATFQFNATVANPHQFDPYIDTYGQAIAASWPSKITSDSDLQTAAAQEQAWLASDPPVAALDQYGGSTIAGWTGQATGYYYAAFHNGHWYMISPLGNPLFYLGLTSIGDGPTAITGRESMFQLPPQSGTFAAAYTTAQGVTRVSFSIANQIIKYGSSWKATGNTLLHQRFPSWGFVGGGKFGTFPSDLPSTPVLTHSDVPNAVPGGHPDAFDPNIVSELKSSLAVQMESSVSSPYIVGWSVGNEIDEIIQSSEVTAILALGPSSPAKVAFVNQALNVLYGGSVSKLAAAWKISATSMAGVYAATNAQPPASDVESLRQFYESTYYSILYKTVTSIDPNHLYFGIWILEENNKDWPVVAANCDVVGFDDFNPSGLTSDVLALFTSTNKPVMIGAWVAAADYGGTRGFGWLPDRVMALSDSAAGDAYAQLLASFAANPYMVGSMIFQYGDGPLTGTGAVSGSALDIGGGDIAWGMVDLTDTPKYDLVNKVRAANIAALQSLQLLGTVPAIAGVVNAESGSTTIAPNTWISIYGSNLAPAGDTRVWQTSDFVNGQMPEQLSGVSVTVGGKPAYVFYISPTQVNVLTAPDAIAGAVQVVLTNNGSASASYTAQAQPLSPSFFVINGGPYVVGQHGADSSLIGPLSLYQGLTTPARPGETVVLYANGFGPISPAVVSGSSSQTGTLAPFPVVTIGGTAATVVYVGINGPPGLFQFNVVVPTNAPSGDNALVATYNSFTTPMALITIQGSVPATSATLYVAPNGSDFWSGKLATPNPANTDGPFATFDGARAAVRALNKTGMTQVTVQFRGGTYSLPATEMFTSADSGSAATQIVYQNYPGESPVFSGGRRIQGWTNVSGNTWKAALPASTQYFENLFYNGVRRLRPRLGGYLGTYYRIAKTVYLPAAATNCPVNIPGSGWECFDRFQYDPADPIANTWKNLAPAANNPCGQPAGNQAIAGDIEVLDFEQFSTSKLRISCIDTANQIVYLTGATPAPQTHSSETGFIAGNRYLVENVQDELTQPGQWFLDRSTTPWTLTYFANQGENPNTDSVIIPQLPQVLVASNLEYVTFQGLTFEHDNYTIPAAGHQSVELEPDISAAVSFQNPQHIAFDSGTVTQTSGTGIEMIPCLNANSPAYCVSTDINAVVTNNVIENSAFYDIGVLGIRIGNPFQPADTDANVPQSTTVQNNVVEGYGRTIPASFGIGQGMGHDNLYTHNDVYDGYHCAISTSQGIGDSTVPSGIGNANNVISFNHVYNLLQGIMNDGGSIRIDGGNSVFTAAGNKILSNKIHDVTDASIMDSNGYGGNGVYLDNNTGLVDVENNLIYRVSDFDVYTPHGPAAPNEANTIKNNILAYGRQGMVSVNFPYGNGVPSVIPREFDIADNLFYFDRSNTSTPRFWVQGGCLYSGGAPFTEFEEWNSNMYWRTDGAFASYAKAFAVQLSPGTGGNAPCNNTTSDYTFYTFAGWQQQVGEDLQSVVQNPGFNNPAYPADDYSLPNGSPGVGFVVFDANQAGRSNPVMKPPAVSATFPTMLFNPATDY